MVSLIDEKEEKKRQRRLRILDRQRKLRIDSCVTALLQHPEGRDYLYWLLELCKVYHNPYTSNALNTAFNCGEMNIGQQIQAHIIEVSPDGYMTMVKEKEEERLNNGRSSGSDDNYDRTEFGESTDEPG